MARPSAWPPRCWQRAKDERWHWQISFRANCLVSHIKSAREVVPKNDLPPNHVVKSVKEAESGDVSIEARSKEEKALNLPLSNQKKGAVGEVDKREQWLKGTHTCVHFCVCVYVFNSAHYMVLFIYSPQIRQN